MITSRHIYLHLIKKNEVMSSLKYRSDIDGLRAVAVISVFVFHFFPSLIPGGFIGVDIFFVISGFLITSIILRESMQGKFTITNFYKKRVIRIFPALLTVLCATYLYGWFFIVGSDFASLGKHIFGGAFFISNILLWKESGYFDASSQLKPLLHLWSLGIEEQFYLFWPLLLVFLRKNINGILALSVSILLISLVLSIYHTVQGTAAAYYSPLSRSWELMAGAIVACVTYKMHGKPIKHGDFLPVIGLGLILISFIVIDKNSPFPGYIALLPVVGASLVILGGSGIVSSVLSFRPFVLAGLISYPLYLWHWPVYSFMRIHYADEPEATEKIIGMIFCIIAASLTYLLVEKPIRNRKEKSKKPVSFAVSVFTVGIVGIVTFSYSGFPSRSVNDSMREYLKVENTYSYFEFAKALRTGECHSVPVEVAVKNGCISNDPHQIFIWGDSYAAALYQGIAKIAKDAGLKVSQSTDGNGPPFFIKGKITDSGKDLYQANTDRLEFVSKTKPEIVVLSWMPTAQNGIFDMAAATKELLVTINRINIASPKTEVIVIGPVPQWKESLIRQVIKYINATGKIPPKYMNIGMNKSPFYWDEALSSSMKEHGVEYISPINSLCHDDSCITRTGDAPDTLTSVDWGHLTKGGSIYLAEKIKNQLIH